MNFRDRWEKDKDGTKFIFTVEMQRRLSQAGLPIDPANLAQLNIQPQPTQTAAEPTVTNGTKSYSQATAKPDDVSNEFNIQIDPQTGKYIGKMKWYNPKKGYGFLIRGAGEEIFFHKSSTVGRPDDLNEGEWVLYDIEETHKGPEATEIEPYSGEPFLTNAS
ncbi:MAG: cold shock domain-containing protein [Chloroflexi bacterium]|nr:cold shock domain-containing protein [Chloroflexota bacterium]